MELKNGYKVIYDKAVNGEHIFYASKTGAFADAEEILRATAGEYKLIYEKAGKFYGSKTGIPAEGDFCFAGFDKVFVETEVDAGSEPEAVNEEPVVEEPVVDDETPVEDPAE